MPCYRKSKKGKLQKPQNKINCKQCGILFVARIWQVKNRGKKYCSTKCYYPNQPSPMAGKKHSKETRLKLSKSHEGKIGEQASNWKGGVTPINKAIRNSFEYEEWRTKVFERDLYTCQLCNEVGGYLQADHIKPFAIYPDLRLELSNGQTLCITCHKVKTKEDMQTIYLRRKYA